MKINAKSINSSSLAKILWEDGKLDVVFQTGGHYRYDAVPSEAVWKVLTAESVGSAFHSIIKSGGFAYERIG